MRKLLAICLLSACALGGRDTPARPDGKTPDGGDELAVPIRGCAAHFAIRPSGVVTAVAVAGEWDWQTRVPMTDPDGDGEYTVDKELPAGVHAYKFVLTRPDGTVDWILDPANAYRAYDAGVENSGMRAADCTPPLVEVATAAVIGTGVRATLRLARGKTGAAIEAVRAVRRFEGVETPVTVERAGGEISIRIADLPKGKHTFVVEATDADGRVADPALVPFWIEDERVRLARRADLHGDDRSVPQRRSDERPGAGSSGRGRGRLSRRRPRGA